MREIELNFDDILHVKANFFFVLYLTQTWEKTFSLTFLIPWWCFKMKVFSSQSFDLFQEYCYSYTPSLLEALKLQRLGPLTCSAPPRPPLPRIFPRTWYSKPFTHAKTSGYKYPVLTATPLTLCVLIMDGLASLCVMRSDARISQSIACLRAV